MEGASQERKEKQEKRLGWQTSRSGAVAIKQCMKDNGTSSNVDFESI
jgi:hypothetical protein